MKTLILVLVSVVSISANAKAFKCSEPNIHLNDYWGDTVKENAPGVVSKLTGWFTSRREDSPAILCAVRINDAVRGFDEEVASFLHQISSIDNPETILTKDARKNFPNLSSNAMIEIKRLGLDKAAPDVVPPISGSEEKALPEPHPMEHRPSASVARVEPPPPPDSAGAPTAPPAATIAAPPPVPTNPPPPPVERINWRGMTLELQPEPLQSPVTKCAFDAIRNGEDQFARKIVRCMKDFQESKSGTSQALEDQLSDAIAQVALQSPKTIRESMIVAKGMINQLVKPSEPNSYDYNSTSIYDLFRSHTVQCTSGTDFLILNAALTKGFETPTEVAVVVLKPRHVIAGIGKPNVKNTQLSVIESVVGAKGSSYPPVVDGKLELDTNVLLAEDFWVSRLLEDSLINKDEIKAQMLARAEKVLGLKQGDISPTPQGQSGSLSAADDVGPLNKSMFNFGSIEIPKGPQRRPVMDGVPSRLLGIGVLSKGQAYVPKNTPSKFDSLPLVPRPPSPGMQSVPVHDERFVVERYKSNLIRVLLKATAQGKGNHSSETEKTLREVIEFTPFEIIQYLERSAESAGDQVWDVSTPVVEEGPIPFPHVECFSSKDVTGESPAVALRSLCPDEPVPSSSDAVSNSNSDRRGNGISFTGQSPKFGFFHLDYEMQVGERKRSISFVTWSTGGISVFLRERNTSLDVSPARSNRKASSLKTPAQQPVPDGF
jgi:hypothetical protein